MSLSPRVLEVTVPSSTSNLGPGFDFLGIALSLFLRVRASIDATPGSSTIRSLEGSAEEWPRSRENLLVRAYEHAVSRLDVAPHRVTFDARSEIPLARGLGSSGAAVAAGLLLASAHAERRATIDELLAWGLELEGHPDNSSAALLGGCTLSVPIPSGGVRVVAQELHPDLGFALAWPASALPTHVARAVLPRTIPFADAVENPRRLALLLEGLRRADPELLSLGSEDRLHFAYRLPLIPGGQRAIAAARAAGAWLATISGSGSALIALGPKSRTEPIAHAMSTELERASGQAWHRVVHPIFGTPTVLEIDNNTAAPPV
jgi:homoserine kinase